MTYIPERTIFRLLLVILITVATFRTVFSADKDQAPALPADAQKIVEDANAVIAKAQIAFEAARAKAQSDAVAKLTKIQTAATKRGDLDLANAVHAKIVELTPKPDDLSSLPGGSFKLEGKALLAYLGQHPKWSMGGNKFLRFDVKQQQASILEGEKVTYTAGFSVNKQTVEWQDHRILFEAFDGHTAVFKWTGVTPQDITLAE